MTFSLLRFGINEDDLPTGWKASRLDTMVTFNPEQIDSRYPNVEIAYLDISNVGSGIIGEPNYLPLSDAPSRAKRIVKPGDSILSTVRPGNRAYAFLRNIPDNLIVSTGFAVLRAKISADPRFVYYLATSNPIIDYLTSIAEEKTAYPSVNPSDIAECIIPEPPLPEQRAIAHILGDLDDKIELNRKMNQTLEDIAQALFKSWFVDFDPVRAKVEGRNTGLPKQIADLFPDSFADSEMGETPKGWEMGVLDQLTDVILGGDWGENERSESSPEPVLCIRGADIPSLQTGGKGNMPVRFLKPSSLAKRKLDDGDIAIEISGGSPTQSTGRPVFISQHLLSRLDSPVVCSNFCRLIKLKSRESSKFIYLWLRWLYSNDKFLEFENGTTGIKNLAFTIFSGSYKIVLPPHEVLVAFNRLVSHLFEQEQAKAAESDTLATLRDILLPKFISGELLIKFPERIIKGVE